MGRGRVEMRRIGNDVSRRAAFGKRRRGLLKKAHELAVLCGVDLGVLVFDDGAGAGKQFDYCSPHTSWSELIERYESITNHQFQFQGINHDDDDQQRREHDGLEASVRRQQTGEDPPSAATAAELDDLERWLECMLGKVREMKDKVLEQQLDESQNKVRILEEQNSFLRRRLMGEEEQQRAAVEASAAEAAKLPATALGRFFPEVEEEEEDLTSLRLWPRQLPDV